ncbi:Methyltransferase domain-containing protein [Hymenobacter gelipurpurascens]|uniref:Methyltransferase domain-containing protein n=1 Tax=Hymenobacter gelipurpurascens TaxID=89968 RepID=A0A212TMX7_9BACT|nr:class I SAM-dependent methyltransferase [Hymenobacter gelipurpurascens]SNC67171.1 Methyltransferase domain-containing protein [Hymenobacter gelipurpurascens]
MPLPDSGFDYVAAFYDPLSRVVYGRALQQAQQAALEALPLGAPSLLIIGGGTGWVLGEVLRLRPEARVLYLEASPQMLQRSQEFVRQHWPTKLTQVEFRLGTEAALRPNEQFDALITFFLLDLFEPIRLRQLLGHLYAARRPGAPWLVADFSVPRTWWQRGLLTAMYAFFGLTTGISAGRRPPIEAELSRLGMRPRPVGAFFGGMVEAVVWE